jgi:hypothetical protein
MTPADAPWAAEALALAAQAPPRQQVYLRFALGKYCDDIADYASAFDNCRRAHALMKGEVAAYDRQHVTNSVDKLIRSHDRAWIRLARPAANRSARPVLILGMPRSGTSLAEQILASHPDIFGAGELPIWGSLAGEASDADPAAAGEAYLRQLGALATDAARIVDKMPANFWHAGLISAALPNARIIHMRRDPVDTCLSIYFQNFRMARAYANDLGDLAHYYREYQRLMQHWRTVLPDGVMLEVPYEDLVGDPEGWTRAMLQFIGMPWDERCLRFGETARRVTTASKWQVRQGIGRGSIGRWRHYRQFIGPLLELANGSS